MDRDSALYNFTQQLQGQVFYAAVMTHLSDEQRQAWMERTPVMNLRRGYAESPNWILVQALEFAPKPLTVERFRRRAVYSAPKLTLALLELMASEQLFDRRGDEYHLTEKGQREADKIRQFRLSTFEGFEPIANDKVAMLTDYTQRVIDASMEAPNPPGTWCIAHSHNRAPDSDAPPLARLVQFGSDFNAFRDDAHMAAFGEYDVEGHVWEAFSYVNDEKAHSARALYEQLAYRGFYTEDWQAALDNLTQRGWLGEIHGQYFMTDEGFQVHRDVEAKTDAYFYAPWDVLSEAEYDDLILLMQELLDACQALTAQPE